jgi:mannose-6-phosphate isomerase-like protein (cupin superfamily)
MSMLRLQGREAGPAEAAWLGLSTIEPGGGTTLDRSNVEKIYMVLDGQVTISNGQEKAQLGPRDSCRIAPHKARQLSNHSDRPAVVLLVMALVSDREKTRIEHHTETNPNK